MPGVSFITSIPKVIEAGSKFTVTGLDFTDGSQVNFFVSTAKGAVNAGPFIPTALVAHSTHWYHSARGTLGEGLVRWGSGC